MMHVEIHRLRDFQDELVGHIGFDGARLVLDPPDSRTLQRIAADSLFGSDGPITAEQPEKFLANLHRQYKSAYLRASEMQK